MKTGIDIVEISRFREMKNLDAFLKRVFTKDEIAYFAQKKNSCESIAGHYAAKEAFAKYLGSGLRGFSWRDMEIKHDTLGKPFLLFMGHPADVDISISHSDTVAVSVVCGEVNCLGGKLAEYIKSYQAFLPKRRSDMHKGDAGRVLVVAGSKGMTGAACLTAESAMRCGSGLVTLALPESEQPVAATKLTEAMTLALPAKEGKIASSAKEVIMEKAAESDVCILGPGLGNTEATLPVIKELLMNHLPLLLDADGLNALCGHIDILKNKRCAVVLTPHPGEMARLLDCSVTDIEENREETAVRFAKEYGVTLVLKGHHTIIASPLGEIHVNESGNSGMATGGMGDVLSGVIGSFIGQGLNPYHAALLGVFLHGLAGDMAASEIGKFGMIAGDVLMRLPKAIAQLEMA